MLFSFFEATSCTKLGNCWKYTQSTSYFTLTPKVMMGYVYLPCVHPIVNSTQDYQSIFLSKRGGLRLYSSVIERTLKNIHVLWANVWAVIIYFCTRIHALLELWVALWNYQLYSGLFLWEKTFVKSSIRPPELNFVVLNFMTWWPVANMNFNLWTCGRSM